MTRQFVWTFAYSQRLGLIWVNQETGERIARNSLAWCGTIIAAGSLG